MTSTHDQTIEISIAVLEERTKVTLTKMGDCVTKLDNLVEQVMEIRASMPTWQFELQRVSEQQKNTDQRVMVIESKIMDKLHLLEMHDSNRNAREGVFMAFIRSPMAGWVVGGITFFLVWLERHP